MRGSLDGLDDTLIMNFRRCVTRRDLVLASSEVAVSLPLANFCSRVRYDDAKEAVRAHLIPFSHASRSKTGLLALANAHVCQPHCEDVVYVFTSAGAKYSVFHGTSAGTTSHPPLTSGTGYVPDAVFPPVPLAIDATVDIIRDWCDSVSEHALREGPCAVCASLSRESDMELVSVDDKIFGHLCPTDSDVSDLELKVGLQPLPANALLLRVAIQRRGRKAFAQCCPRCLKSLRRGDMPVLSLANGLWVGDVPPELA